MPLVFSFSEHPLLLTVDYSPWGTGVNQPLALKRPAHQLSALTLMNDPVEIINGSQLDLSPVC